MAVIENFIIPLFAMIFLVAIILWIGFLIYKGFQKFNNSNFKFHIKYNILKLSYKDDDVSWCIDAFEKGIKADKIEEMFLLKGHKKSRAREMIFIYNQCLTKLQGGVKSDE